MKGVVFTTDGKMFVKEFTRPLYKSVSDVVAAGGRIVRDADKVKVIEHVCVDALEFGDGESPDFFRGVIQAVASICDYKERNNE